MSDIPTTCEITWDGYLRLPAQLADRYFPAGVCVAVIRGPDLVLMPLHNEGNGGLVLKRRNVAGDRSLLISEVLGFRPCEGCFGVLWKEDQGALIVALDEGVGDGSDGADRSRPGAGAVGGLPLGDRRGGDLEAPAVGPPVGAGGEGRSLGRPACSTSSPASAGRTIREVVTS